MKRGQKALQQELDIVVLGWIQEGIRSPAALKAKVREFLQDCTFNNRNGYRFGMVDIIDVCVNYELGATKQRLRKEGHIEITKNNKPIPIEELTSQDHASILSRRMGKTHGSLVGFIRTAHKFGYFDEAAEGLRMLAAANQEEAETLASELDITF